MKYINIVLVAFGAAVVVYAFSATFWNLTVATPQPLEITKLPASGVESPALPTAPASAQRPVTRRTVTPRPGQSPSSTQEDVPDVLSETPLNAPTSQGTQGAGGRGETSVITAGRPQTGRPSSAGRSPSSSSQIRPSSPPSSRAGGRTGLRQSERGGGFVPPPPQGAERAKRGPGDDSISPPPVRGSIAGGRPQR